MDTLILEDVRSFGGRQEVPLAPLTILVGENSTGKSTFLAAARIASDLSVGRRVIDFNEDPFRLGAYEQIATFRGGRAGRAKSFVIGQEVRTTGEGDSRNQTVRVEGRFASTGSQLYLADHTLVSGAYRISLTAQPGEAASISVTTPNGRWDELSEQLPFVPERALTLGWDDVIFFLSFQRRQDHGNERKQSLPESETRSLLQLTTGLQRSGMQRPYAFAPVRSRPQRTYDPITDVPDPEGQHIPMVLARLLSDTRTRGTQLRETLAEFGKASGLFSDIATHRLGKEGDPFQVLVRMFGPKRNLMDVGYGVSQILPILVEIFTRPSRSTFLIQQPEVHLHPRAQAALATLFARLVREQKCQLIVETHSDYFIDRLRLDVRDHEMLSPQDVKILYFELDKGISVIHPISIDMSGNVLNAPSTYRHFFLEEERRFFSVS